MSKNINLLGWDTTYAISFYEANHAIKELNSTPPEFIYNITDINGNITSSISGSWDHWTISTKSDGQNLVLRCPIKVGIFTTQLEPSPINMNDSWVEVQVQLAFIESEENLQIDTRSVEGTGDQMNLQLQKDGVLVTSSSFDFASSADSSMIKVLCETVFAKYFEDHIGEFNHVFSTFVINQQSTNENLQWLKPTYVNYALTSVNNSEHEETNMRNSTLGVMCMTEGREPPISGHMIDSNLLNYSGRSSSAFAISGPLFLKKALLPTINYLFEENDIEDFEITNVGLTITNHKEITWDTFKDSNGKEQYAKIPTNKFQMTLDGKQIRIDFDDIQCDTDYPDKIAHIKYSVNYDLSVRNGRDSNGDLFKNSLQLTPTNEIPNPTVSVTGGDMEMLKDLGIGVAVAVGTMLLGEAIELGIIKYLSSSEIPEAAIIEEEEFVSFQTGEVIEDLVAKQKVALGASDSKLTLNYLLENPDTGEKSIIKIAGKSIDGDLIVVGKDPNTISWGIDMKSNEFYERYTIDPKGVWGTKRYPIPSELDVNRIPKLYKLEQKYWPFVDEDITTYLRSDGIVISEDGDILGNIDSEGSPKPVIEGKFYDNLKYFKGNIDRVKIKGFGIGIDNIEIYPRNPRIAMDNKEITLIGVVRNDSGTIEEIIANEQGDVYTLGKSLPENFKSISMKLIDSKELELTKDDIMENLPTIRKADGKASIITMLGKKSDIFGITNEGDVIDELGNVAGIINEKLEYVPFHYDQIFSYKPNSLQLTPKYRQQLIGDLFPNVNMTLEEVEEVEEVGKTVVMEEKPTFNSILEKGVNDFKDIKVKVYSGLLVATTAFTMLGVIMKNKIIEDKIKNEEYSKIPSLDEFGQSCLSPVKWPNVGGFELQTASLNSCLLLGGNLLPEDDVDTL
ncbi:TULIP family P47-like protein [Bacillus sp. SCS-151]|uniref:TULIP family P47-like protein n=1 Tax=Nanhaiella sioensis TaxID=3115293 RepID=UPI00397D498D